MPLSRDEYDLPYPRHPAICEPEAMCVCGDPLSEHAFVDPAWKAITERPTPIPSEVLFVRRHTGETTAVNVFGHADGREYRCKGGWADQRCHCRRFVEATPEQADFVRRRRAADYLGLAERRHQLRQDTFNAIWWNCAGDEFLRARARRLAERHGLTVPDEGGEPPLLDAEVRQVRLFPYRAPDEHWRLVPAYADLLRAEGNEEAAARVEQLAAEVALDPDHAIIMDAIADAELCPSCGCPRGRHFIGIDGDDTRNCPCGRCERPSDEATEWP